MGPQYGALIESVSCTNMRAYTWALFLFSLRTDAFEFGVCGVFYTLHAVRTGAFLTEFAQDRTLSTYHT